MLEESQSKGGERPTFCSVHVDTLFSIVMSCLLLPCCALQVIYLNDAKILSADLPAANGYIHIIDKVCLHSVIVYELINNC